MARLGEVATSRALGRQRPVRARVLAVVPTDCSFEHMAVNQRLRALAEVAEVDIIASYPGSFPSDLRDKTRIRACTFSRHIGTASVRMLVFSAEIAIWAALHRMRHLYRIVYTFQDTSACAGLIMRGTGTRWVMDILDDPSLELRNAEQQGRRYKAAALRLRAHLIGRMLRGGDLVITIGCAAGDPLPLMIRQRYQVDPARLLALPQAINAAGLAAIERPPPHKTPSDKRTVFYVGWVSALRGVDTLIEAVDLLRGKGENIELRLAGTLKTGEIGLRDDIESRPYIRYLGILPSVAVRDEILSADICCCPFPDREELAPVQPVKLLEYLALGRPTVGSRTHGMASVIVHERSGLLVTPGSADSFADAFARIFNDERLAARIAEGARVRASEFDVARVNRDLQRRLGAWL
jgi:glycosyltransferase involved in cell wall biosynthesis